ncbi:restriction endonuclease subunit S [Virgibacillus sp. C22-A2]|uniref:Restriction endonuclease subunit S n=1 Tax=Virgibacillus tibetensis TaxID=3042313 RepID=A0ABU6KJ81_9BACI|nr:restriction endonuclease subunit S [Virgibacillus sp. C22-A2]
MKLEEFVSVRVGRNISRINEIHNQTLEIYSYEDLTEDIDGLYLDSNSSPSHKNAEKIDVHVSEVGNVVFSFVSSKAAIVSEKNAGKIINQNFAKLMIEDKKLDPSYLCYALNESQSMKKQMAISMQGSTIPKLTPAILKSLDMKLPSVEKQQVIGKAYLALRKRIALAKKQADLEELLFLEVLKKLDE